MGKTGLKIVACAALLVPRSFLGPSHPGFASVVCLENDSPFPNSVIANNPARSECRRFPLGQRNQRAPPSLVRKIVPLVPTAVPVLVRQLLPGLLRSLFPPQSTLSVGTLKETK
jgi:hypothetical protein